MSQMETAVHSSLKTHINQSLTSFLPPLVIGLPQEYSTHGLLCTYKCRDLAKYSFCRFKRGGGG